jgi:UDP-glucuronate 4-epimerase
MIRDFTYVDDICDGVLKMIRNIKELPRYKIYNLGNNRPVTITAFIEAIEEALGRKALVDLKPMQAGDVVFTCADITGAANDFGYTPKTGIGEGIANFVKWYREYYNY